ncbi:unnamed protein product [Amaranthus hypochondriacus]
MAINLCARVIFLNGLTESDWGTFPIPINNPNLYKLPHLITVYLERNDQNYHQTTIPINKFMFSSIKNHVTGEIVPNYVFRKRNSDYTTEMVEVEEMERNSVRLNSINLYYHSNHGGVRSNSSGDDDVHRPKCMSYLLRREQFHQWIRQNDVVSSLSK